MPRSAHTPSAPSLTPAAPSLGRSWESVVEALTSNTNERTDEVVLVFERPL